MSSASPASSAPVVDFTGARGDTVAKIASSVTSDQWKAIKRIIDTLYAYRQSE